MPAGDLDNLMSLNVGGLVQLQVLTYDYKSEPIVKEGQGLLGSKITLSGTGYIAGTDTTDLATQIAAGIVWMEFGAKDVIIKGLGGVPEVALLAAQSLDGGPFITFDVSTGPIGLQREVKFSAVGTNAPTSPGGGNDTWKLEVAVRPDKLRQIIRSGEVRGPTAANYFDNTVVPLVRSQYPATQWVLARRREVNFTGDKVTYAITLTELVTPLPGVGTAGGATTAVDGEMRQKTDRDDQMRKTIVTTYDLVINGDPEALAASLRPSGVTILKESLEYTKFKETRMLLEFVQLVGGNGNDLLDWQQTFEASEQDSRTVDVLTYPGTPPVFALRPQDGVQYVQSGRAVGAGRFVAPPTPVLTTFSGKEVVKFTHLNEVEKETTWNYPFVLPSHFEQSVQLLASLGRPVNPSFVGD